MKWSILILTMPERSFLLCRLLKNLIPQLEPWPDIELIVKTFDERYSLGENREQLRKMATGEYLNFIDDDDLITDNYVVAIRPLLDGIDYISFPVQSYTDGQESWKFDYSLKCSGPYGVMSQFRDISHLHPMRRELSLAVPMEGGREEDIRWANRLRELGIVRTEHHISETLYIYLYLTKKVEGRNCVSVKRSAMTA